MQGYLPENLKNASPSISGFELAQDAVVQQKQLSFNQMLVQQSNALLAPINLKERYLSVSSGHLSQFVKAALAECFTSQSSLQDLGGKLNRQTLSRDPELKKLLESGWEWTVVSWKAESTWPLLPSLAEKALNASNSAFTAQNEVEFLLQLVQLAQQQKGANLQELAKQLGQEGPLNSYSSDLGKWVEMYSSQGDFLRFLGPFSKQFGDGVNLGQEFWAAASGPLQAQLPMVRLAMLASNYTAPQSKIANGLARLIVKADFDKLKSSKIKAAVDKTENGLFQAWSKVVGLLPDLTAAKAFGVLCIRCTLHLLGKEHFVLASENVF